MKTKIVEELVKLGGYKVSTPKTFSSTKLSKKLMDFLSDLLSVEDYE